MHFLLLSVVLSVSVSVLLKLAARFNLDIRQAIAVNYLVAAVLTAALLQPQLRSLQQAGRPGLGLLLLLGAGLPTMFWVLALAVRRAGVVRTDAAMRLSLLLPLVAAFAWFGEPLSWVKAAGIAVGLLAIALVVIRQRDRASGAAPAWSYLLLLVFAGMGAVDILFKLMSRLSQASSASVLLAAFMLAGLLSLLAVARLYLRGLAHWHPRHLLAGLVLGALNFGNIVFYIHAHRALPQNPSLVFAAMNIGVIVLATLVGVLAFRERLGRWNIVGLVLAVLAVAMLAR
ncbi:MAG: EamA/RhaT family transporter [Rhodanobacteraceae bacterium]